MKFLCLLLFVISPTIYGQDSSDFESLLSKSNISFEFNEHKDFIEDGKIYKIRDNSVIVETFANETVSDTIMINTELDLYSIEVSKTGNIYVKNYNYVDKYYQKYLINENVLVAVENYGNEEFANQINEINWNSKFSENEIEAINNFFNQSEKFPNYNVEYDVNQKLYKSGNTKLFLCAEQTLGYGSREFLFKINENNIAELLYVAETSCDGSVNCFGEDFLILDDILYVVDEINYGESKIYKIEGNISTNFTLSNSFIPVPEDSGIYLVENHKIKILNNNYNVEIYNLKGQEIENKNLPSNTIYLLKITNITNQEQYVRQVIIQ